LIFKKKPEKIKAIMVTVRVASDVVEAEDFRARVAGFIGRDRVGNYFWNQLQVRNLYERIECWTGALETPESLDSEYEAFFAFFKRPLDIVERSYTLTIYFSNYELKYSASGLGTISHILPVWLYRSDEVFKGIGTRSNVAAGGTAVVYFDDVYVKY
jgi:hypothetical protein